MSDISIAVFNSFDDAVKCEREIFEKNFPGGPENVTQKFDNVKWNKEKGKFCIIHEPKYEIHYRNESVEEIKKIDSNEYQSWEKVSVEEAETLRRKKYDRLVNSIHDEFIKAIAKDPDFLNNVEWRELERIVSIALRGLGFDCELTPSSKDGGKDVIVRIKAKGSIDTYYIEIKHWKSKKVGKDMVKDFLEVIIKDNAYEGLFLSTSGYSKPAIEIEKTNKNLKLKDSDRIVTICSLYSKIQDGLMINRDDAFIEVFKK